MSEADREREQRQRRHVAAHEDAAAVHERAAKMHQDAADFFDDHDQPAKAKWERDLVERESRRAEAERRGAPPRTVPERSARNAEDT